jgi:Na+-driven multidrug efflux pump
LRRCGVVRRYGWVSAYASVYMASAALLITVFTPPLIALFDPTPEVVAFGAECARIVAWSMVFSAVGVALARSVDGAGNTVPAMAVNLLTLWGMELPIAFALSRWLGLGATGVWWGRAIANLANGVFFAIWFRRGKWEQREI